MMHHHAVVALSATCGELVQGTWNGVPCLVSCPIDLYATARVEVGGDWGWQLPDRHEKADLALQSGRRHLRCAGKNGRLYIHSPIPRGRGYGSSTADIGATLFALAAACGLSLPPAEAAQLAVQIEPSDSTLFPGLAIFDHCRGSFVRTVVKADAVPPLAVLLIDPGGEVQTLAFHRRAVPGLLDSLAPTHARVFDTLLHGFSAKDWEAVGAACTLSSQVHQKILFNPLLEKVVALAKEVGALGVCRAHSGTLLGLLLPASADLQTVQAFVNRRLPQHVSTRIHRLVGGGPRRAGDLQSHLYFQERNHVLQRISSSY